MSIFDRFKTSFSDKASSPAAPAAQAEPRRRFMGRDQDDVADSLPVKAVEKGLDAPSMIWLYGAPGRPELRLVKECGSADGAELNTTMLGDLRRLGICEAVAYHAGYDKYWKMPSQESLVRMPALYHVGCLPVHRMRVTTKLVRAGEAQGLWLHVRVRTLQEVQAAEDVPMV